MTQAKLNRIDPSDLANNPRATLACWQRYEPIVVAAMEHHPKGYIFTPHSLALSPQTIVSRVRDAIRGKIAFEYPSTLSTESVRLWYAEVIFKIVGPDAIYIGPKEALKTAPLSVDQATLRDLDFPELSFEEIAAFALLLSSGRIHGPIVIRHPPPLETLPAFPNFQPVSRPDGSLVLL